MQFTFSSLSVEQQNYLLLIHVMQETSECIYNASP